MSGKMSEVVRESLNAFKAFLNDNLRFLLVGHVSPDGDCVGSLLALYHGLRGKGKEVMICLKDPVPEYLLWLDGVDIIRDDPGDFKPQVVITADCSDLERTGFSKEHFGDAFMVIIDHHISNQGFGDLVILDSSRAATGEIVYELLQGVGAKIGKAIAEALFTAISTDTGSFKFQNTTQRSMEIAAELIGYGADPGMIAEKVYETKSFKSLKLLAYVLSNLQVSPKGLVSWITVTRDLYGMFDVGEEDTEGFVNYARMVKDAKVSLLFRESPNGDEPSTKVSFRSRSDVDVSRIAERFGGGGHIRAAGARVSRPIEEVRDEVLREVFREVGE